MELHCAELGSSVFGVGPILLTKNQDISACATLFKISLLLFPQLHRSAVLNCWSKLPQRIYPPEVCPGKVKALKQQMEK